MTTQAVRAVLAALADGRDADTAALQRVRDTDPETAALMEQAADRVARLRRRDAQFAAVVAMTHDLVAQRHGSLLDSIVERAHELLGSDMTYISAYNSHARTFTVRAVQGETSPDFRGMIVPPGVGIATRVVEKMSPVWVDDYPRSYEFPHDGEIDRIVGDEQISSILGVPLLAAGTVLGVLFVADRRHRRYTPDEIGLARSFADHAAIVIEQGNLVADLHAASARADHERRRAESTAEAVRKAAALHEELTALVASGADPRTIAAALGASLERQITVVDADLDVLAGPEALVLDDHHRADGSPVATLRRAIAQGKSAVLASGPAEFIAPIVVEQTAVGALLVERGETELSRTERRSVERSGVAFALVWMQRRAVDLAEERIRGELVTELTDTHGNRGQVVERVRTRGLNPARPWEAAHFLIGDAAAERMLRTLRADRNVLAGTSGGRLWVFTPESGVIQRIERAARIADVDTPLIVQQDASTLTELLDHLEPIRRARDFAAAMGQRTGVLRAELFAPYTVLFDGRGERAAAFIDATLRPILDWDGRRGAELFTTLLASLDEQGSVTAIARRLSLHPNTVRQRLDRIGALLPGDWTLPDARFRLEIAARLEAARRAIAP